MFPKAQKELSESGRQNQQGTKSFSNRTSSLSKQSNDEKKSNSSSLTSNTPNIEKSQQSYLKNKAETEFYLGLIKERALNDPDNSKEDEEQEASNQYRGKQKGKIEYPKQIEKANIKSKIPPKPTTSQKGKEQSNLTSKNSKILNSSQNKIQGATQNTNNKQELSLKEEPNESQKLDQSSGKEEKKMISKKSDCDKLKEEIDNLNEEISAQNRINYEQSIKIKEDKLEQKRLKQKIQLLESEKNILISQMKEKDAIICQGLAKIKDNFEEKRNFLIRSQMIKQRYYIQHLTKLTKSNRLVQTELEYQLDTLSDILESSIQATKINSDEQSRLKMQKQSIINLKKKLNQIINQASFQFSKTLLKEYDQSEGQEISKQTLFISLEQTANKIYKSTTELSKQLTNPSQQVAEVIMNCKELMETCLQSGMEVQLQENECEIIKSNENIRNEALRNLREKIGGFDSALLENILYNGKLFEFLHRIQVDRSQLVHLYQNNSSIESMVELFSNNNNEQNKKIIRKDVIQKIKQSVSLDLDHLGKMNNIVRVLFFQSQISLQYLNSFVVDQLQRLDQIIKECIYKPLNDMREIRQKYLLRDKDPNYPYHLVKVFDIHCDSIFSNLQSIIDIHHSDIFQMNTNMNLPLINQIFKVYDDLVKQLK